jgi:Na+/H+-dicarboxylate symporter
VVTSTDGRWVLGWGAGAVVVVIAATLLLAIIALCRRIVSQAEDITRALDGARENTNVLFGVASTNATLERITRDLRAVRERSERT